MIDGYVCFAEEEGGVGLAVIIRCLTQGGNRARACSPRSFGPDGCLLYVGKWGKITFGRGSRTLIEGQFLRKGAQEMEKNLCSADSYSRSAKSFESLTEV